MAAVTIVDDNEELRVILKLLIKTEFGLEALGLHSLRQVQAAASEVLRTRLALIDINLGPGEPDGVAIHDWLRAQAYRGRIFFFTGHAADTPPVQRAQQTGAQVLEKPMTPDQLIDILREALREDAK